MSSARGRLARGSSLRGAGVMALGTLLVVSVEFWLLISVYYRGQQAAPARAIVAQYSGRVQSADTGAELSTVAAQAPLIIGELRADGVKAAVLTGLAQAGQTAVADPSRPANLSRLRSATDDLTRSIVGWQRQLDAAAEITYVVLLLIASVGWMAWFRRMVRRQRALQKAATEQLGKIDAQRRLDALSRNAADLVVVCEPDSTVLLATQSAVRLLGYEAEALIGGRFSNLVEPESLDRFARVLSDCTREDTPVLMRLVRADGGVITVGGSITNLIDDPSIGGLVLTLRDITDRLNLEEQLSRQSFSDTLTGLANRQLFVDRLGHALIRRIGVGQALVVLLCDLDDFKLVNDSLGHGVGDEALALVGARAQSVVRTGDTAARMGGDEFAVLMENTDLAGAMLVAERLQAVLNEPLMVGGTTLTVTASIGLAQAVPGEMTSEDALRNADVAMYLAKDRGKSGIAVYESQLHAEALDRLELRTDLVNALRCDEGLVLHYQPVVDLLTHEVLGFEALVRWQHPSRGMLAPNLFIPMAEESGLIAPLGSWVLREACRAAVAMTPVGAGRGPAPTIAVNVASLQLEKDGFVAEVVAVLAESGLESRRLTLEITEGVILHDLKAIAPRLMALRKLGVRIAIDDFGTGYSSLAYLSHLPIDVLKVDKSFVDRVTMDQQDASVTAAIIAMGRTMKMKIVAEGVEQLDQAQWLQRTECDIGQGYLWSRPVPFAEASALAGSVIAVEGLPRSPHAALIAVSGQLTDRESA